MPDKRTNIAVGLDIGTTKVCTIVGETDPSGRLSILGSGLQPSDGIRRGVVADIEAAVWAIRASVKQAEQNSGVDIDSVTVGVTGEHVSSLNSHGVVAITNPNQEIGPEDVERVMDNARSIVLPPEREILHNIPRSFIVDGLDGVLHPEGMSGSRLEVESHIVTGARTFIDNVLKCVYKAGLHVDGGGVVLVPLATAEAVLLPAERDLGVLLVDIGGGTTDVAIFLEGSIAYTGVVPIAGEHVTRDLAVGLRADMAEAERLKMDWGTALSDLLAGDELVDVVLLGDTEPTQIARSIVAEIIEARMIELFEKVRDLLRKSGYEGQLPAGAVITGGGSRLHGCDQVAAEVLEIPTRLGAPVETLGMVEAVNHPRYSTGVGLVRLAARNVRHSRSDEPFSPVTTTAPDILHKLKRMWRRRV